MEVIDMGAVAILALFCGVLALFFHLGARRNA
jgi:hypothetical protein